jgi:hypothetical protein
MQAWDVDPAYAVLICGRRNAWWGEEGDPSARFLDLPCLTYYGYYRRTLCSLFPRQASESQFRPSLSRSDSITRRL